MINKVVNTTSFSVLLMAVIAMAVLIYIYRNQLKKRVQEVSNLKTSYQQEILKAQLEMQEQTFRAISREIHDNIGQLLSLTRLNISTIKPEEPIAAERKINNAKELLDHAIEDLRDLSKQLNTEFIIQQPLSESLQSQLNLIKRTVSFTTHLEIYGEEKWLEAEKKLIIFRIAQEAINNILKHARAKTISVVLIYLPNKIDLSIRDDGKGFETPDSFELEAPQIGIGLHNMYHRASLIKAQFSIQSQPNKGTVVQLSLPTIL